MLFKCKCLKPTLWFFNVNDLLFGLIKMLYQNLISINFIWNCHFSPPSDEKKAFKVRLKAEHPRSNQRTGKAKDYDHCTKNCIKLKMYLAKAKTY